MNLPSIKPQSVIAAAALLAPMLMVQTVRMLFGSGPGQANAQVTPTTPAPGTGAATGSQPPALALTPKQKAAVEHLTAARSQITIYTSPFNHLTPRSTAIQTMPHVQPVPGNVTPPPTTIPSEVRGLALGALMTNENGTFALISGKVRAVGDVVVPGWTVSAIDSTTRRVTITSDEGLSVTLTQNR